MTSYCLLADLKTYLNITTSTDDALLQVMLDAATARINSHTGGRNYLATLDTIRTFDPIVNLYEGLLWLDEDLSYITSVINGDSLNTDITDAIYTEPRNRTPYYRLGLLPSSSVAWQYTTDPQNAISITGRWAYMKREAITAISRTSNVVTATVRAPDISVGSRICVVGVADNTFNGTFTVVSNNGTQITWAQTAGDDTDATGTLLYTPVDIVTACRRLAAWMYRQKDNQLGDQLNVPVVSGDGTMIMPTTLPQDVSQILKPYVPVVD